MGDQKAYYGLIAAAIITALIWRIPFGYYILYPFTTLAVWFHEMAHGIMALILGGGFSKLMIFENGSGLALYTGPLALGRFGEAMVAAAGPLGPTVAGAGLIIISRDLGRATVGIWILGLLLLVSTIIWIRSFYGLITIPLIAAVILLIAIKGSASARIFTAQFLGVQACVSVFRQIDYLFSYHGGPTGVSDTALIQKALFLPYWFWGGLLSAVSIGLLWLSLRIAYGRRRASL
jgi:hypothetical protein